MGLSLFLLFGMKPWVCNVRAVNRYQNIDHTHMLPAGKGEEGGGSRRQCNHLGTSCFGNYYYRFTLIGY